MLSLDISQRRRYFSLYSIPPGSLLDEAGWYSVTPELTVNLQIAERCRCDTILDTFVGLVVIRSLLRRPASEVSLMCLK